MLLSQHRANVRVGEGLRMLHDVCQWEINRTEPSFLLDKKYTKKSSTPIQQYNYTEWGSK